MPASIKLTLVIRTKLAAAILGGVCSEDVFCRPSTAPLVPSHPILRICCRRHGLSQMGVDGMGFCPLERSDCPARRRRINNNNAITARSALLTTPYRRSHPHPSPSPFLLVPFTDLQGHVTRPAGSIHRCIWPA